ncbi:hypothetical protein LXA43DRAFT_970630 [Ganoderma leucocontextum]|nr:hypothetical protein LXA43DRAFT_970630 [Ganoderma leucocontextum]
MRFSAVLLPSAAATSVAQEMSLSGGDATCYDAGLGSCGLFDTDADFVVAVDIETIQSFPGAGTHPNLSMKVTTADGKSVTVTVADSTCPTCAIGSVDLTSVAFQQLSPLAVGRLHNVSWTLL